MTTPIEVDLPGVTLAIDTTGRGLEDYRTTLLIRRDRMENLQPALDAFGFFLLSTIEQRFQSQGQPRWAPLKPRTVAEKRRLGFGDKGILERTGQLRRGFRKRATRDTLVLTNNRTANGVNLFAVHQSGTRRIPARPMMVFDRRARERLAVTLRGHIE